MDQNAAMRAQQQRRRRVRPRRARLRLVAVTCLFLAAVTAGALVLQESREDSAQAEAQARARTHSATGPSASASIHRGGRVTATGASAAGVYAAITTGQYAPAVRGIKPLVYVPNNNSNTVDVIDPATYKIIRHFAVGYGPQHITPAWDLSRLYVGNTYSNTVTVIDPRTAKPTGSIHVFDTYNLYFTPDGTKAVDVAERMNTLFFYDP